MTRIDWEQITERAAEIVRSYDTSVTLRQLFYRLVALTLLPNTRPYYQRLSSETARRRRVGTFPDLLDRTSRIERRITFGSPEQGQAWFRDLYRRDRTEGQAETIYLGVEKAGLTEQLDAWFTDPLGIPHVALGGYASQTIATQVARDIERQGRPAILIYAGDFDPTGNDIDRDFVKRVGLFDKVIRVGLNVEQIAEYGLVYKFDQKVERKLARDPRAAKFERQYGDLVQYELDALDPTDLRDLYRRSLADFFDLDAYTESIEREAAERERLP